MINEGFNAIFSFSQMVILPSIASVLTMLSFTFLGVDCVTRSTRTRSGR